MMRLRLVCVLATVLCAMLFAEAAVDENTTLYADFERSAAPIFAAGDWRAAQSGSGGLVEGRLGKALSLGERRSVTYPADGKINPEAGTLECWLLWTPELAAADSFNVVGFTTAVGNYTRINLVSGNRLGMPFNGGPKDQAQWQRVDVDPSGWAENSWHHIAGTWQGAEIRLYIDGQQVDASSQAQGFVDTPTEITVGPGPLVIDDLHISRAARSADEIARSAAGEVGGPRTVYLTDLPVAASEQALGTVGIDAFLGPDDRRLPLIVGERAYARGIAIRARGWVEFTIPQGIGRLTAVAGLSAFGPELPAALLRIMRGETELFSSGVMTAESAPVPVDIAVTPGETIRIEAGPGPGIPGTIAVLADPVLLPADATPPPSFSRPVTAEETELQQMQLKVADYSFHLPDGTDMYALYEGHPVDAIDPALPPPGKMGPDSIDIELWACPGEYEAAQFTIVTAKDMSVVRISLEDFRSPDGTIPKSAAQVYLIRRGLQRDLYPHPPEPRYFETTSRFLFPNQDFWLEAGTFKEVQVLVHVPEDAAPGEYTGRVYVTPRGLKGTAVALKLRVLPLKLLEPQHKRYGQYYHYSNVRDNRGAFDAELADMAAHGCTTMWAHLGPQVQKGDDGTITWDLSELRTFLQGLTRHGFHGPLTVADNLIALGRAMGYPGLNDKGEGEPMSEKPELLRVAAEMFADMEKLNAEFPQFEFVLTHMDEVFGRGRLERYIDLARVVRKTTSMPLYITHHTQPGGWETSMEKADPYIDIRCMNGHSLETWLQAGNDWETMAELLEQSGDSGWIYHNMRGAFFRPEWNRFINGLFMWVSPLEVHIPWMYYSVAGDPFDDTDSQRYDFVYAVPMPGDPTTLVSTLHWEAFREGYDDMRYIVTLEETIKAAKAKGVATAEAEAWLDEMRAMLPQLPDDIAAVEVESPYTALVTERFCGVDYDRLRRQTALHAIKLQEAMGERQE